MADTPGKTVLVVDDSAMMRHAVSQIVRQLNHNPVEASNGKEGLAIAEACNPDLIILDLVMPEKGGMEMLQDLRGLSNCARTPVILVTQVKDAEIVKHAGPLGVADYLSKPPAPAKLRRKIRKFLD